MLPSTAVAILSLIGGVALSVALPLPAIKFERAGGRPLGRLLAPRQPSEGVGYTWHVIRPGQPQTIVPRPRHARTRPAFRPIRRSPSPPHSTPHSPPSQTPESESAHDTDTTSDDIVLLRMLRMLPPTPTHTPILYPPNHPPVVPLPNHPPIPSPPHPSSTQTTPPLSAGPSRQATGIELMTPTDHGYNPPIVGSPPMVGSPTTMGSPGSVAHPFTPPAMDEGERLGWDQHLQEQQHRYHDLDSLDRRSFQN